MSSDSAVEENVNENIERNENCIELDEFDRSVGILNIKTPLNTELRGQYKKSFAYYTFRYRLPNTLNSLLKSLNDDIALESTKSKEEFKVVISSIQKLKAQLETDCSLEVFEDNESDSGLWNDFICKLPPNQATFYKACWLYSECYLYRKIASAFKVTESLKHYDYFEAQKNKALNAATCDIIEMLKRTNSAQKDMATFVHMLKLNLWGNRCDLSITSGQEVKPLPNLVEQIHSLDSNILIDDSEKIWNCLQECDSNKPIVIDIICDNAGFELFTDLLLASYIIQHNLAKKVRFYVKTIPWYISDTTRDDISKTLEYFCKHESKYLQDFGAQCCSYFADGKFQVEQEEFWTTPHEYFRMPDVHPALYENLKQSSLLIFKGDLNYRKLLGDFNWDFCEEFKKCLRGFQPTNLCTLRTVKGDLICGLQPGISDELFERNREWMFTGEFAVIQFNKNRI